MTRVASPEWAITATIAQMTDAEVGEVEHGIGAMAAAILVPADPMRDCNRWRHGTLAHHDQ